MRSLLHMMAAIVAAVVAVLSLLEPISAFTGVSLYRSIPNQVGLGNVAPALSRPQVSMMAKMENVAAVVLAGGVGKRMEAGKPKQFLELDGKPVLDHSLELFRSFKGVSQLIVVLDKQYRHQYDWLCEKDSRVVFADPGKERQDSVFNAFKKVDVGASVVCIHDSARPLVTKKCIRQVVADANEHGAAVLGVLMKVTVKESEDGEFVLRTIDRSRLWDIQTPQVVKPDILKKGFEKVKEEGWVVTDDGSIVEQLGLPVKLTMGEYTNIKLTTPDDLLVASQILEERRKKSGTKDDDDDDDGEEERLSMTRANAKWSNQPPVETPPSTGDQYESLSERRAKEEWSKESSSSPQPGGAKKQQDEGPENISIKRANESFAPSASAKKGRDVEAKESSGGSVSPPGSAQVSMEASPSDMFPKE